MTDVELALRALMPAIDAIDGGCCSCIGEFIDDANKGLEAAGIKYRYQYKSKSDLDATFEYVAFEEATA